MRSEAMLDEMAETLRGELARIEGVFSLRGARACVRKGPATEDCVPDVTEPIDIWESEPTLRVSSGAWAERVPLRFSFRLAIIIAFRFSSSYFLRLGSSGSTKICPSTGAPSGPSSTMGWRSSFVRPAFWRPSAIRFLAVRAAIGYCVLAISRSRSSLALGLGFIFSLRFYSRSIMRSSARVFVCPVEKAFSISPMISGSAAVFESTLASSAAEVSSEPASLAIPFCRSKSCMNASTSASMPCKICFLSRLLVFRWSAEPPLREDATSRMCPLSKPTLRCFSDSDSLMMHWSLAFRAGG